MSAVTHVPWLVAADGVLVDVRLTPRGSRDAIEGTEHHADGRAVMRARVRAVPFEGAANAALCRLLAGALRIAPRQVTLVAGATARVKRIRIAGDPVALVTALRHILEATTASGVKTDPRARP
ncbi:MAG TPA: DUF167 family protein [Xanthobacteraceae bacterium]